ncbi:TPA: hypothetical protein ACSTJZ_000720 [Serratia fonticola]
MKILEFDMNKQIAEFSSHLTQLKLDTLIKLYFNELSEDLERIRKQSIVTDELFDFNAGPVGHLIARNIDQEVTVGQELFEVLSAKLRLAITSI